MVSSANPYRAPDPVRVSTLSACSVQMAAENGCSNGPRASARATV